MASCIEALGMSVPYAASHPAMRTGGPGRGREDLDPRKVEDCTRTAQALFTLLDKNIK